MKQKGQKIFYLKRKVVFPYCSMTVLLSASETSKKLSAGNIIITYPIRSVLDIIFSKNKIATQSEITHISNQGKSLKVKLKGLSRIKLKKINRLQFADFEIIEEPDSSGMEETVDQLRKKSQELIFLVNVDESDRLIGLLNYIVNLNQITDFISNYFVLKFTKRYKLFTELNINKRSNILLSTLDSLIIKIKKKRSST